MPFCNIPKPPISYHFLGRWAMEAYWLSWNCPLFGGGEQETHNIRFPKRSWCRVHTRPVGSPRAPRGPAGRLEPQPPHLGPAPAAPVGQMGSGVQCRWSLGKRRLSRERAPTFFWKWQFTPYLRKFLTWSTTLSTLGSHAKIWESFNCVVQILKYAVRTCVAFICVQK